MSISQRCRICKKMSKLDVTPCHGKSNMSYQVRVQLSSGKWISKLCPTLELAKNVQNKFKVMKVEEQVFDIKRVPTLDDVWSKYITWAKHNKASWTDDEQRWRLHVVPHLKPDMRLNQITPAHVSDILSQMRATHKPATVQQVFALIRRVFNWSAKQGLHQETNPCSRVEVPKFDNRVNNILGADELERFKGLIDSHQNMRFRVVVKYALNTGKRLGEILKLTWMDVDMDKGLVTYRQTKNGRTITLPVNRTAKEVLMEAAEHRISELVFPSQVGGHYTKLEWTWRVFRKKHGFSLRFHDLRHQFASMLASSGKVDIYTLQQLLGHRSLAMTSRYSHLSDKALQRAVDVLNDSEEI